MNRQNSNASNTNENKWYDKLSLARSSFLMLLCGLLYCISGLSEIAWTDYISTDKQTCYVHFYLIITSYGLTKLFMYVALCRRLIEVFGHTKFLLFWEFFLIIASILSIILCPIFIRLDVIPTNRPPCNIQFNDLFLIALVLYDCIVCIVNLILFIRPLCKISNNVNSEGHRNKKFKQKYKSLIRKNAILACISIITSFIVWIILGFITGIAIMLQSIDIVVSSVAILLLFSRNKWLYKILCGCCDHGTNHSSSIESQMSATSPASTSPASYTGPPSEILDIDSNASNSTTNVPN